jgi:hypothetical protein
LPNSLFEELEGEKMLFISKVGSTIPK